MDRTGLVKLPGRAWVYRRRIPKDLQGAFGKSEWFRSLDTHDEAEALRLYPEVHTEYERRLRQARDGETLEPETNLFVVVGMFVHDLMGKLEYGEDPGELLKLWLIEQNDEENPLTDGIAFTGPRFQKILAAVTEIIRGMRIRAERNREWTKPSRRPPYGESMHEVGKRWSEQPGQRRSEKTVLQYCSSTKAFDRWYESRFDQKSLAAAITNTHVNEFVRSLMQAGKAKNTIQRELAGLRTVYRFGEFGDHNPFDRVSSRIEINGTKIEREDFTPEQARELIMEATASEDQDLKWTVLIGLYAGLRLGEIASITAKDVKQVAGQYVFDLNKSGGRRLKTINSYRQVPVHQRLIELGLIKHVQELNGNLLRSSAAVVSKRLARFIDHVVGERPEVTAHSMRHTFITRMAHEGIAKAIRMTIVGHAGEDVHDGYSHGAALKQKADAVNRVIY